MRSYLPTGTDKPWRSLISLFLFELLLGSQSDEFSMLLPPQSSLHHRSRDFCPEVDFGRLDRVAQEFKKSDKLS